MRSLKPALRGTDVIRGWATFALALALTACTTVTLLTQYDEQIDRAASDLQRRMDGFLTRLESQTGDSARYAMHRQFYAEYLIDLRSVELRASTHPKNRPSLEQYQLMLDNLEQLRSTHERQGTLGRPFIGQTRTLFNTAWKAIIALEVAKKRGQE
jgi:hypothetical protein